MNINLGKKRDHSSWVKKLSMKLGILLCLVSVCGVIAAIAILFYEEDIETKTPGIPDNSYKC